MYSVLFTRSYAECLKNWPLVLVLATHFKDREQFKREVKTLWSAVQEDTVTMEAIDALLINDWYRARVPLYVLAILTLWVEREMELPHASFEVDPSRKDAMFWPPIKGLCVVSE